MHAEGVLLAGQGKPLPNGFPYKGQWLLENWIFLYRSDMGLPSQADTPSLAALGSTANGRYCFGVDVTQLAMAFQTDPEQIFEHNRKGTLFLATCKDVPPSHGCLEAKLYILQIGSRQAAVTVERGRVGRA